MKRLALVLFGVLLVWPIVQPCRPTALEDWYIGHGTGATGEPNMTWGVRNLTPTQTSLNLAPNKPYPGCVVAYRFLPENCTPENLTADGQSWEGM